MCHPKTQFGSEVEGRPCRYYSWRRCSELHSTDSVIAQEQEQAKAEVNNTLSALPILILGDCKESKPQCGFEFFFRRLEFSCAAIYTRTESGWWERTWEGGAPSLNYITRSVKARWWSRESEVWRLRAGLRQIDGQSW